MRARLARGSARPQTAPLRLVTSIRLELACREALCPRPWRRVPEWRRVRPTPTPGRAAPSRHRDVSPQLAGGERQELSAQWRAAAPSAYSAPAGYTAPARYAAPRRLRRARTDGVLSGSRRPGLCFEERQHARGGEVGAVRS